MTIAELLLPEWDMEISVTRAVLARVPDARGEWKPHEKSFSMAHLAQLVSMLPGWVPMVLDRTELDIAPKDGPKTAGYSIQTIEKLLADFDTNAVAGRASIAKTTDAEFQVPWSLEAAGVTQSTMPRYLALRTTVINHLVHHRAQLGLYLRLVDEKVPNMYGPTADTKQKS
ncbi:MAG: DinB family protein [Vicinamibacterales bacterium]